MKKDNPTKSQRYNKSQEDKGLRKATSWIPAHVYDDHMALAAIICDFYLEKGEFHKDLFPSMYRDLDTGVMGNKTLAEVKKLAEKAK